MNMKNEIKQGSFVKVESPWGDYHWCEIVAPSKPLMSSEPRPEQTYFAKTWIKGTKTIVGHWEHYTLAPDTAHKGMVKEVLNLDPAVADIFTMTTLKGEKP